MSSPLTEASTKRDIGEAKTFGAADAITSSASPIKELDIVLIVDLLDNTEPTIDIN